MKTIRISGLEQLNSFLNSANYDEDFIIQLVKDMEYILSGDNLVLKGKGKVIIEGNGAILRGNGKGNGILVQKGDVEVRNLIVEDFFSGIRIEGTEENITKVFVHDCVFRNIHSEGVSTAIIKSGVSIENICVNNNIFIAPTSEMNGHCSTAINFMTACYTHQNMPLHHVALKHVQCCNNKIIKNPDDSSTYMLGITVHGASAYGFYNNGDMINSPFNDVVDSLEEDITIQNNIIEGVWDIAIDVLAAFPGRSKCTLSKVNICNNKIKYHNTAINVGTTNIPHNGQVQDCHTNTVFIRGNELIPDIPGPNEPQIGIMLFTVRAESGMSNCRRCSMTNLFVMNNVIHGREIGIALEAIHATQDLPYPSVLEDCKLENILICDNEILNAQLGIRCYAAHLEGRNDPFWGFELPPFGNELPFSTRCENAVIKEVTIAHNKIKEYDMAFTLGAAWGCGHAFIRECMVSNEVYIYNNELNSGRKVFCYEKQMVDEVLYDAACGTDNCVMRD